MSIPAQLSPHLGEALERINVPSYVLDRNGTELGHNKLNAPLAFPEGTYSVRVANETRPVTLTAAKITVLNW